MENNPDPAVLVPRTEHIGWHDWHLIVLYFRFPIGRPLLHAGSTLSRGATYPGNSRVRHGRDSPGHPQGLPETSQPPRPGGPAQESCWVLSCLISESAGVTQ
jgi:hypothetical protein